MPDRIRAHTHKCNQYANHVLQSFIQLILHNIFHAILRRFIIRLLPQTVRVPVLWIRKSTLRLQLRNILSSDLIFLCSFPTYLSSSACKLSAFSGRQLLYGILYRRVMKCLIYRHQLKNLISVCSGLKVCYFFSSNMSAISLTASVSLSHSARHHRSQLCAIGSLFLLHGSLIPSCCSLL